MTAGIDIRLDRAPRRLRPPTWAVAVVAAWLGLVLVFTAMARGGAESTACVLKSATTIPCPTCGSTRAVLHATEGQPLAALAQNPFVVTLGVGIVAWLVLRVIFGRRIVVRCSRNARCLLWTLATVAFLANWAYVIAIDGPWTRAPTVTAEPNAEAGTAHE